MRYLFLVLLATVASQNLYSQKAGEYVSPLDIKLELTANYAEVRSNRFHSGIDLRTGGREGLPVRSVADGYISRVGVVPGGFGRVLYVAHPNGKTTVYAHLQKFIPEIEEFATQERYNLRMHSIDESLPRDKFPVKAGQIIGYSGNSGMSYGPHLHFELRNSADQRTLEPVAGCGLRIPDSEHPRFLNLYYVATDTIKGVPVHAVPRRIDVDKTDDGVYTLKDSTILAVGRTGYFLTQVADSKNSGSNGMAVRRIVQKFDGDTTLVVGVDGYLYSQTRYASSMTYYPLQQNTRYDVYKLAVQQANRLPVYSNVKNRGVFTIEPGAVRNVEIVITDDSGNSSSFMMNVVAGADSLSKFTDDTSAPAIYYNKPFINSADGAAISITPGTMFESAFYTQRRDSLKVEASGVVQLSDVYTIGNSDIPMNKNATLHLRADVPERLRPNVIFAVVGDKNKISAGSGQYSNGGAEGRIRSFGRYCVVADTLAPTITPSFKPGANLQNENSVTFTLKDNFSGIKSFSATIDGKWILFERDIIKRTITHRFDNSRIPKDGSRHNITVEATDDCGNKTVYKGWFTR